MGFFGIGFNCRHRTDRGVEGGWVDGWMGGWVDVYVDGWVGGFAKVDNRFGYEKWT